ncbi:MAG: helix-turn-helix domain-containing protein [Chitinophagaceae bacterium]|jgi:AraC-like DNA-binding protein
MTNNCHLFFEDNFEGRISVSQNPGTSKGVCFTENVQLLIFNKLPDSFDIDFVSQKLKTGVIYIIPPDHKYFIGLNASCQFFCLDISITILDAKFRQLLNAIAYQEDKSVEILNPSDFLSWVTNLNKSNSANEITEILKQKIIEECDKNPKREYLEIQEETYSLGNRFLDLLLQEDFNIEFTIKYYASKLGCCTKTLQRACLLNFKIAPQKMIRHHLFIKSLRLLSDKNVSIENVALKLGYSTHNAFCKFTKAYIDLTPREIRRKLLYSDSYL